MIDKECSTISKFFGKDFNSTKQALTLSAKEVSDMPFDTGHFVKKHDDGWEIEGFVLTDGVMFWVNEFMATHPKYGNVYGDFELEVISDTEEGFQDFYTRHCPESWDYDEEDCE